MPESARRHLLDRHARQVAHRVRDEATFHEARVLMLVAAYSADGQGIPGLPELSRLDFLLRFPPVLDHVPTPGQVWPQPLTADRAERQAVTMLYGTAHYGLWSDRYLRITGALVGRHLISVPTGPEPPGFVTADAGRLAAQRLAASPAAHDLREPAFGEWR